MVFLLHIVRFSLSKRNHQVLFKVWRCTVLCSWLFLDFYQTATGLKRNTWPGAPAAQSSVVLLIPTLYYRLLSSFLYSRGSNRKGERITSTLKRRERQCFCEKKSETCWVPETKGLSCFRPKERSKLHFQGGWRCLPEDSRASRRSAILSVGVFLPCFTNPAFF